MAMTSDRKLTSERRFHYEGSPLPLVLVDVPSCFGEKLVGFHFMSVGIDLPKILSDRRKNHK